MKKRILFIGVLVCLFAGCVDLDQKPLDRLTPENVEYTQPIIESLANGLRRDLWYNNYGYNCRLQILNVGADDIVSGTYSKRYTQIDRLNVFPSMHDDDSHYMWMNMFSLISSANFMIEYIPPSTLVSEEVKNPYLGEAYFMRAFAYFNLVRFFGEVPLFTDPNAEVDIYGRAGSSIQRAPIEDVYDKMIIPDLLQAEEYLPHRGRTGDDDNSVVCKWAAKACLADVYLTMAGWPLKRGQEYYKKAQYKSSEIIQNGGYSLVEKYSDLWKEANKSSNVEHIFALNHSSSADINMASNYGRSYYAAEESASAWSDYLGDSTFYTRYPNDKRKEFNYITSVRVGIRPIPFTRWAERSPAIAKYRDYGDDSSAQSDGITPVYRFAEVLLMYAEAQNKADGAPNDSAYMAINKVRYRAMESLNDLTPNLDGVAFDKAVSDEFGWEFFAEFKRWFHLVRREQVWEANQYNPHVRKSLEERGITADNRNVYLMPIPEKEIIESKFPQNPR